MPDYQYWREITGDVGDPSKYGKVELDRLLHIAFRRVKIHKVSSNSERKRFIQEFFEAADCDCAAAVYAFDAAIKAGIFNLGYLKGVLKNHRVRATKGADIPCPSEKPADSPRVAPEGDKGPSPAPSAAPGEQSEMVISDTIARLISSFHGSLPKDPAAAASCHMCNGTGLELMIFGVPDRLIVTGHKYHPCRDCHPDKDFPVGLTWPLSVTDDQVLWPMWPRTMDHGEIAAQLEMIQLITEGDCKNRWCKNTKRRSKLDGQGGYVYFIQAGGLIKIGWSKDVKARLKQLRIGNPLTMAILGSAEGSQELEQFIHKLFKDLAIDGEWFRPDQSLIDFIGRACGGKN